MINKDIQEPQTTEVQDIRTKRLLINPNAITRNVADLGVKVGNIYASLVVMGKRAKQINVNLKEELTSKLNEFATTNDNLEEVFENREQIEISKYYEKMANPSILATEEYINEEIFYYQPEKEEPSTDSELNADAKEDAKAEKKEVEDKKDDSKG